MICIALFMYAKPRLLDQATKSYTHDHLVVYGIAETKPIYSTHFLAFLPTVFSRHGNVMKKSIQYAV